MARQAASPRTQSLDRLSPRRPGPGSQRPSPSPTPAQAQAWAAIGKGEKRAAVVGPCTGSGKTLAAFSLGIDKLANEPVPQGPPAGRCRVLYILAA